MRERDEIAALLDRVERGEGGALAELRARLEAPEDRPHAPERREARLERELDTWRRRAARAHEVLDPQGDWALSFRAQHGRPSARAERMAEALRILGLPEVREPKLTAEAEKVATFLALGLGARQALERTLAESPYESLAALRAALTSERDLLEGRYSLARDHDPDLTAERVRQVAAALRAVLELPGSNPPRSGAT